MQWNRHGIAIECSRPILSQNVQIALNDMDSFVYFFMELCIPVWKICLIRLPEVVLFHSPGPEMNVPACEPNAYVTGVHNSQ